MANKSSRARSSSPRRPARVWFSIPLDAGLPGSVRLTPGSRTHFILAFSREDDFQHHAAMRTAVDIHL